MKVSIFEYQNTHSTLFLEMKGTRSDNQLTQIRYNLCVIQCVIQCSILVIIISQLNKGEQYDFKSWSDNMLGEGVSRCVQGFLLKI